jgi:hypothetical protein
MILTRPTELSLLYSHAEFNIHRKALSLLCYDRKWYSKYVRRQCEIQEFPLPSFQKLWTQIKGHTISAQLFHETGLEVVCDFWNQKNIFCWHVPVPDMSLSSHPSHSRHLAALSTGNRRSDVSGSEVWRELGFRIMCPVSVAILFLDDRNPQPLGVLARTKKQRIAQWVLQVMFPSACRCIVLIFTLTINVSASWPSSGV